MATKNSWQTSKRKASVLGSTMAYVERGSGDPIVFLHGNPTSSFLWRNVIPHLESRGRCITPDLIGMGDSDKLADSGPYRYTFAEHARFLDAFLDMIGVTERVTLVVHDWGSALGFHWANRHRRAVQGIAYMEAIVRPLRWSDWPESMQQLFRGFRSPIGDDLVLAQNAFVEGVLPAGVLRALTEEEHAMYRAPFQVAGEGRRPTLTFPRQIPIEGEPADVVAAVDAYGHWLAQSTIPKLFVNADPGAILVGAQREFCRSWRNQTEVTVRGVHYLQEDSPAEIGRAIAEWHSSTH